MLLITFVFLQFCNGGDLQDYLNGNLNSFILWKIIVICVINVWYVFFSVQKTLSENTIKLFTRQLGTYEVNLKIFGG